MLGFFTKKKDNDHLLQLMLDNQDRVTIGDNGVIRVNFDNKEVQAKLKADLEKLKELEDITQKMKAL